MNTDDIKDRIHSFFRWSHNLALRWNPDLFCISLIMILVAACLLPFQDDLGLNFWLAEFFLIPATVVVFGFALMIYTLEKNRIERVNQEHDLKERQRQAKRNIQP